MSAQTARSGFGLMAFLLMLGLFGGCGSSPPSGGSIAINSTPLAAGIFLDAADTARMTPYTLTGVAAGDHEIKLVLAGYADWTGTVSVADGATATVEASLTATLGSIAAASTPPGAAIFLDGNDTGRVTPYTLTLIPPGEHSVALCLAFHQEWTGAATVIAGETALVEAELVPGRGSLTVSSTPAGAAVYLDGADTGQVTPASLTGITAGSHPVKLVKTGYEDWIGSAIVNDGETTPVTATLYLPELFISEYLEGSSYNKALEIYNFTGAAVDLTGYSVRLYVNGSATPGSPISLSGVLASGEVFILANTQANETIKAQADQLHGGLSFNGDDAIELVHDGVVIDSFGQVGNDPGSCWGTEPNTTVNHTLVRKAGIIGGDRNSGDAFDPAGEWEAYEIDTLSDLGGHAIL